MKRRVLVIEDEETLGFMIADLLRSEGWQADVATNGDDALRQLDKKRFALVLLDWMLPLASAEEILARVARGSPRPRVVVMTSRTRESLGDAEFDDFLAKPFRFDELLRVARKAAS